MPWWWSKRIEFATNVLESADTEKRIEEELQIKNAALREVVTLRHNRLNAESRLRKAAEVTAKAEKLLTIEMVRKAKEQEAIAKRALGNALVLSRPVTNI